MDLCNALAACKRKNIIHRDIKPANIMLIEILKEISTEVTTRSLPYLLMLDISDETLSHMKYGLKRKNSPYTAYWPDHESWLNKARTNVRLKRYMSECKNSGLLHLLDCCPIRLTIS